MWIEKAGRSFLWGKRALRLTATYISLIHVQCARTKSRARRKIAAPIAAPPLTTLHFSAALKNGNIRDEARTQLCWNFSFSQGWFFSFLHLYWELFVAQSNLMARHLLEWNGMEMQPNVARTDIVFPLNISHYARRARREKLRKWANYRAVYNDISIKQQIASIACNNV